MILPELSVSVFAAIEEKVDIVDLAIDPMSGLTSQSPLGSIVSIMKQIMKIQN